MTTARLQKLLLVQAEDQERRGEYRRAEESARGATEIERAEAEYERSTEPVEYRRRRS